MSVTREECRPRGPWGTDRLSVREREAAERAVEKVRRRRRRAGALRAVRSRVWGAVRSPWGALVFGVVGLGLEFWVAWTWSP